MRHGPKLVLSLLATSLLAGATPLAIAADTPSIETASLSSLQKTSAPVSMSLTLDQGKPINLDSAATSVFVANPEIADVQVLSPTTLMVFGKKMGQTTLMATDATGRVLTHRTLRVEQNLDDLRGALQAMIPGNTIGVKAVPNGILLSGTAKDPTLVEDARRLAMRFLPEKGEIINRIRVEGNNQIHIRVRFAEVSRGSDKRLGVNWESLGMFGSGYGIGFALGNNLLPTAANAVPTFPQGAIGSQVLNRARPVVGGNPSNILSLSNGGFNATVDALASEGLITILAEPNLTAMSGQTASFLAGGEFPVPIPQSNNALSVEFKPYGVSLAFTPTIIGKNRINMHVRPEVSQLSDAGAITLNGITIQALTTRRAETTIELGSGESFVVGGLLNNNQNQNVQKYPFLGDLPVLGALFRSTRFQNNQSELVIIITPYIVKPSTEEELALATDGFSAPSDIDQMIYGRQTNRDPDARPVSGKPRAALIEDEPVAPMPPVSAAPVSPVTQSEPLIEAEPAATPRTEQAVLRPVLREPEPEIAAAPAPIPEPAPAPAALPPEPPRAVLTPAQYTPPPTRTRADPFAGRSGGFMME